MPGDDSPGAFASGTWRSCRKIRLLVAVVGMCLCISNTIAMAGNALIIHDDRGGGVVERAQAIERYRQSGIRVEIRGNFCMSACTMYLGLENTCVRPETVFGFHGPSSSVYGVALSPASFERWSRVMAAHYPEPLRAWFLSKGRHRTVGFHRYDGAALIELGIERCADL